MLECGQCKKPAKYYNVCYEGTGRFPWCIECYNDPKKSRGGVFKLISSIDGPPIDAPVGVRANVKTPSWFDLLPE